MTTRKLPAWEGAFIQARIGAPPPRDAPCTLCGVGIKTDRIGAQDITNPRVNGRTRCQSIDYVGNTTNDAGAVSQAELRHDKGSSNHYKPARYEHGTCKA